MAATCANAQKHAAVEDSSSLWFRHTEVVYLLMIWILDKSGEKPIRRAPKKNTWDLISEAKATFRQNELRVGWKGCFAKQKTRKKKTLEFPRC